MCENLIFYNGGVRKENFCTQELKENNRHLFQLNPFVYFVLLLPLIRPAVVAQYPSIEGIATYLRLLSALIVALLYMRFGKMNVPVLVFLLMQGALFLSTIYNGLDTGAWFNSAASAIALVLLVDLGCRDFPHFLKGGIACYLLLVFVNLITILLFPDGMYQTIYQTRNWFLGYDNNHLQTILPGFCFAVCYAGYFKRGAIPALYCIIAAITIILTQCAAAVVSLIVLVCAYLFINKGNGSLLNFRSFVCIYYVLFFLIVVFRFQEVFGVLIEGLGKNLTFTGRTLIWDSYMNSIAKAPVFGYGVRSSASKLLMVGTMPYTHNHVLEVLFSGGALFAVCWVLFFISIWRICKPWRGNTVIKMLSACCFALMLTMIVESYEGASQLYVPFTLLAGYGRSLSECATVDWDRLLNEK